MFNGNFYDFWPFHLFSHQSINFMLKSTEKGMNKTKVSTCIIKTVEDSFDIVKKVEGSFDDI